MRAPGRRWRRCPGPMCCSGSAAVSPPTRPPSWPASFGGTREPLDPVRYIGNRSSGRMGAAIVGEALRRGAAVTAVAAASEVPVPAGARALHVGTAQELYDAVLAEAPSHQVVIMAAAVADFRPKSAAEGK